MSSGEAERIILLADDNPDDVDIVTTAFRRAGYNCTFLMASSGEEAIEYLSLMKEHVPKHTCPIPALLLLDLKMPIMDGFEVLRWVRSRPEWRTLPILILTSSSYGPDINRAYDLGANSFLTKPGEFNEYVRSVKRLADFWLFHNVSPKLEPFVISPEKNAVESGNSNAKACKILEKVMRISQAGSEAEHLEVEQKRGPHKASKPGSSTRN